MRTYASRSAVRYAFCVCSTRARASRKLLRSRSTPRTATPLPMPGSIAYIAGTVEPPTDWRLSRCRLYPSVLAFAMFCPATSRPRRAA